MPVPGPATARAAGARRVGSAALLACAQRAAALLLACAALAAALVLAWHHPLWPLPALLGVCVWSALTTRHTGLWLFALPLGATVLNFSPWTGWLAWDECDLLLLSTLAGAYTRLALHGSAPLPAQPRLPPWPRGVRALWLALVAAALLGLLRGWLDAQATTADMGLERSWDWFGGYTDAPNSLRVAKSELYALLLAPLWPRQPNGLRPLACGLVASLAVVVGAVLWERLAFPGLLDLDAPYRSVALFWEMHVGGEAIDAYLALATPFAVWAVLSARRPWSWLAAALLAVATLYAVLCTFSRGVYAAELAGLCLLALLLLRQGPTLPGWRAHAATLLGLLLAAEVVLIAAGSSFLWQRVAATQGDLHSRLQHWQRGLSLLQDRRDWLLGLGPGRLPAHYAASGTAGEFSGAARWVTEAGVDARQHHYARLSGPRTRRVLGGQFALAQRTRAAPLGPHTLTLSLRVPQATELLVQWCERHLLYDGHCQSAMLLVRPAAQPWQTVQVPLRDETPPGRAGPVPRLALFTLSVVNAGGVADLAQAQLQDAQGHQLLNNAHFAQGLAHWMVAAQSYFLPWHIDNLYLELIIERGLLGLLLFGLLLGAALWRLTLGRARHGALAPYQAAALLALLCVGASGSVLDVPRVALLLYVLALEALLRTPQAPQNWSAHAKNQRPQTPPAHTGLIAAT